MPYGGVTGIEPTIANSLVIGLRVFIIAFHHGITADHNFALGLAIARHQLPGFIINHRDIFIHRKGHALPALQFGFFRKRQIIPFFTPDTLGDMTICLGQPINLHHFKPHGRELFQNAGRRRCASRHHLNGAVRQIRTQRFIGVDKHPQNNRRATKMRHLMRLDKLENLLGGNRPGQHNGCRHQRSRPGMPPAVAMKHRHGVKIGRVLPQLPGGDCSKAHQIGTAMMVDNAFWPT